MTQRLRAAWCLAALTGLSALAGAVPAAGRQGEEPPAHLFSMAVPAHAVDVILGRPGADRVTLSVLTTEAVHAYLAWGDAGVQQRGPELVFAAGVPRAVEVTALAPDRDYRWELRATAGPVLANGAFHTQRGPGRPFTFTITADSHLDQNTSPELYLTTLRNAAADAPDFHLDLGDTFMTEKFGGDFHQARAQYLAQRYCFGLLSGTAPLFLVLGNHDGEVGWLPADGADSMPAWSCHLRKALFPNPEPGGIYTGNASPLPGLGLPQDYYAWTWGDALYVVLDPFWPTQTKPSRQSGAWAWTLGAAQYQWLRQTLAGSTARWRFVFIHHLVGGADERARGGAEAAPGYEWGGRNADGTPGFAEHRPGWGLPIHDLLRRYGVAAVFHGHDHFYARQVVDGIVYQCVPQPGHRGRRTTAAAASYGYRSGDLVDGSGHLRVRLDASAAHVEFVRAVLPEDARPDWRNGVVAASYALAGSGG